MAAPTSRGRSPSPMPRPTATRPGSTSCSRRWGLGRRGSASSRWASGSGSTGRSATPSPSRASWPRTPRARSSSAVASGSRRWRCCGAGSRPGGCPPRSSSASATAPIPAASTTSSRTARSGSPPTTATAASAATSPTCWRRCSTAMTRPRQRSTPAGRRRCWRRSRQCARRAGSPASSPTSRRWPAATAPASAAPSPPDGSYARLCVDGPVLRGGPDVTAER